MGLVTDVDDDLWTTVVVVVVVVIVTVTVVIESGIESGTGTAVIEIGCGTKTAIEKMIGKPYLGETGNMPGGQKLHDGLAAMQMSIVEENHQLGKCPIKIV